MLPTTKGGGSPQHSRWPLLITTRILMNHVNPERGGGERCEEDAIVKIGRTTETIHSRKPEFLIRTCFLALIRACYFAGKVANTCFVWVEINNIPPF